MVALVKVYKCLQHMCQYELMLSRQHEQVMGEIEKKDVPVAHDLLEIIRELVAFLFAILVRLVGTG